jgi:glutamyl-tRNA reductase
MLMPLSLVKNVLLYAIFIVYPEPLLMSFNADSTTEDVLQGLDLTGTHAVVTGASGGLGEETARALASHGAAVILASRNLEKTRAVANKISQETGNSQVIPVALDLADFDSVRQSAKAIAEAFPVRHSDQ